MAKKKHKHEAVVEATAAPTLISDVQQSNPNPSRRFSKPVLLLLVLMAFQSALCGYLLLRRPKLPAEAPPIQPVSELDRILALPEDELQKISLARINLLISKEIEPNLDVEAHMSKFNGLVEELRQANLKHGAKMTDPDKLIRVLNTYLFFDKKFRYAKVADGTDPSVISQDPKNLFLYGILERMQGTCISMPVLYIALGEAMGYPIKGVNAGDHFFCRWDGAGYTSNIEATGGGGWSPDEDYIRDMKVTEQQIKRGAYMRSLSKRELIGNFFFARAGYYSLHGQNAKATQDLLKAVAWNSRDVDGFANLADLFARQAHRLGRHVDLEATYSRMTLSDIRRQDQEMLSGIETGRLPMPGNPRIPAARGLTRPAGNPQFGPSMPDPFVADPLKEIPGLPGQRR